MARVVISVVDGVVDVVEAPSGIDIEVHDFDSREIDQYKGNRMYQRDSMDDTEIVEDSSKEVFFKSSLIPVWSEGWAATGGHGTATFHGEWYGKDLKEAVKNWHMHADREIKSFIDLSDLTYWGCRLFDNEKDARNLLG